MLKKCHGPRLLVANCLGRNNCLGSGKSQSFVFICPLEKRPITSGRKVQNPRREINDEDTGRMNGITNGVTIVSTALLFDICRIVSSKRMYSLRWYCKWTNKLIFSFKKTLWNFWCDYRLARKLWLFVCYKIMLLHNFIYVFISSLSQL